MLAMGLEDRASPSHLRAHDPVRASVSAPAVRVVDPAAHDVEQFGWRQIDCRYRTARQVVDDEIAARWRQQRHASGVGREQQRSGNRALVWIRRDGEHHFGLGAIAAVTRVVDHVDRWVLRGCLNEDSAQHRGNVVQQNPHVRRHTAAILGEWPAADNGPTDAISTELKTQSDLNRTI